ncbi:hypothetical protein BVRB_8g199480 [Beta vulgaris subsp. vulgaris]|uniref:NB-ARC domain-containing protein n=1 Tax=Beta vulgaris subsp. vulgaris TaxID=3555 RepID=A0A0J8BA45_BETVV|nr:hypothetical protein BVRB_8g199480 [Beta vulgaris subsp. vulgaris]
MILSTQEVEDFIGILICLFLERQLLGLSGGLHNCLRSAINFFEEKEWNRSCEEVVKSIADRCGGVEDARKIIKKSGISNLNVIDS